MKQQKKIALITYYNFPFGGASANFVRNLALGLSYCENEIEVILPKGNYYGNKIDINKKRKSKIGQIKYRHLCYLNHPKNIFGKIIDNICGFVLPLFYLLITNWKHQNEIVIVYNISIYKILMFFIAKKILKNKLVIILPEFSEKPKHFFLKKTLKWYSVFWSLKFSAKYADGFIVLSQYLKKYLEKDLNTKKSILLLPNLIDPHRFTLENIRPYFQDKTTIGYVGTPTSKDGVLDLIKSFSILNRKYSNTHLLIIGDITNGKTIIPALKEYARKLEVLNNISFTGLMPYNNIPELLHACQILALTRPNGVFAEAGFPTKLGEYFACKKPVVITKVGDISYYFESEKHVILVEPENINSITKGFEKLISNEKLGHTISNNAYDWMEKELNYKNVACNIDHFLNLV